MKKFFENKPRAWFVIGLIAVVLLTAGALSYFFLNKNETVDPNVLAIVGSEKITKLDLTRKAYGIDLSGDLNDPDLIDKKEIDADLKKKFFESLIRESVVRQVSGQYGLSVSEEEIQAKAEANPEYKNLTEEQVGVLRYASKNLLLEEKLKAKVLNVKIGSYLNIRFDRYMIDAPAWLSEAEKSEWDAKKLSNQQRDRAYADKLKDDLYAQLKTSEITFEQAMQTIRDDKTLNYTGWENTIGDQAVSFDTSGGELGFNPIKDKKLLEVISGTAQGKISEPFLGQLDYSENNDGTDMRDSMWTILTVTDEVKGETDDFEEWLNGKLNELGLSHKSQKYSFAKFINVAKAWTLAGCSAGRYNQDSSHPGDVIAQTKIWFADGTAEQANNQTYMYTRPQVGAKAYTGCDIPVAGQSSVVRMNDVMPAATTEIDATLFWHSEISNTSGCLYKFSSVSSSKINQCCGGSPSHNPHQYRFKNEKTGYPYDHGRWNNYYTGYSNGSMSGSTSFGWGQQVWSDNFTGTIVNGETLYIWAWFLIPANTAPVSNPTSPINDAEIQEGTNNVTFEANATDANNDNVAIEVSYRKTTGGDTSWKLFNTAPYIRACSLGGLSINVNGWRPDVGGGCWASPGAQLSYPAITLSAGTYEWRVRAVDHHWSYGGYSAPRFFTVEAVPPTIPEPTLNCACSPQEGLSPLVVMITATGGSGRYNFNVGEAGVGTFEDRTSPFYYTYGSKGEKTITCSDKNATSVTKQCKVNVSDPTDPGGGEVTP